MISDAPEEHYRNRFLAQAMVELKMVDTIGSGIRRMFNFQRERLFPMPDYELSDNRVQVTITGKIIDNNYSTLLAQNPNLTINDVEILSRVLLKRNVSTAEIDHLRKLKLIEGRKPNVYISKNVAQTVGKKVTYTKIKGFNDKYYKDLICQALEQHGQLGRKEFEELLIDKLPDALSQEKKVHKVGNLLTSLRKKGLIKVNSSNKWILSEIKQI